LVVSFIKTLKSAKRTFDHVDHTLASLAKQMVGITTETTSLLGKTNRLADGVNQKAMKMDVLFDGMKEIGDTTKEFNQSLRQLSANISEASSQNQEIVSKAVKWSKAIMDLWKKNKK